LAWQGLAFLHPQNWFLRSFGGTHQKGSLRVCDDDGLRVEVLWETPRIAADVPASIQKFLGQMEREAKKAKRAFRVADHPDVLPRRKKDREQATSFGWSGHSTDPLATQGWGASWQCAHCQRVVVAHLVGRAHEATRDTQRLATEIFTGLSCHGTGGWETWAVFGMKLEVPEEFEMKAARLLAGRIECAWERVGPQVPLTPNWTRFDERIEITRISAASIVLQNEALGDYISRTIAGPDKKRVWNGGEEAEFGARKGWLFGGQPSEPRKRALFWAQNKRARNKPPAFEMRAWHDALSNKIFVLTTQLRPNNAHVAEEILESLEQQVDHSDAAEDAIEEAALDAETPAEVPLVPEVAGTDSGEADGEKNTAKS
jgi:hypothetical protein